MPRLVAAANHPSEIQAQVAARYVDAGTSSESGATAFNRSPRLVWAFAARNACGIALGHLAAGEVELERIWKCECYHARMSSFREVLLAR